jgi:hypothetical protein
LFIEQPSTLQQNGMSVILMAEYAELKMLFTMKFAYSTCLISFLLIWGDAPATTQTHPLAVYLQEGFNAPGVPSGWTVTPVSGTTSTWTIVGIGTNPPIPPNAGTGQAKFNSYDATPGHQSRLTSQKVSLSAATDPFLTFFLYHDDEYLSSPDSVYVEATTGDSISGPWTALSGYRRPNVTPGWREEVVSLLQYSGLARVFLSFRGVSQYGNNMYLDELRIADSSFHDIGMLPLLSPSGSLNAPSLPMNASRLQNQPGKPTAGAPKQQEMLSVIPFVTPLSISTIVRNYGTFSEPTYQVRWQIDGQSQTAVNNARTLARNDRDTLTLSWPTPTPGTHVITAWISLTSDSNRSNDSLRLTVSVLDSSIIFVEMFNSAVFPPAGWTAVNRDGGSLTPWFLGSSTSVFVPSEGTGFAANNFQRANGTYIDDYLISPVIPGIGQTGWVDSLKFWVRSAFNPPPATNYPDSLMVLLSTTGADTSNFTTFVDYFSVPKTGWTLKGYRLTGRVPNNSNVRVALRYLHFNGGSSGVNSDFVGVDFIYVTRNLPTAVESSEPRPTSFSLYQNYPNPFNPSTVIAFVVDAAGRTTMDVFDVLGRHIATLYDAVASAGPAHQVKFDGTSISGGIYFCRLQSGGKQKLMKMVLLK